MPVGTTLETLLSRLVLALRSLVIFVVIMAGVYLPGRFVVVPLISQLADRANVDETIKLPLLKVAGAVFVLLGIYLAVPLSGLATTPTAVAAIGAGATIAIGFASRDILANLVSGTFIVLDPEFHIGDWIRWDGKEGIIEDISFRVTRVHTFDNELITVPNSELTASAVINPVAKDRLRITFEFGIGYDDDIDRAREILIEEAAENEDILDRPGAQARLIELANSYVGLRSQFWIADPARADFLRIRSEYAQTVKERFDEEGIEMPYPYRQLTGSVGVSGIHADDDSPGIE